MKYLSVMRDYETCNVYDTYGHRLLITIPYITPYVRRDPMAVCSAVIKHYESLGYIVNSHLEYTRPTVIKRIA